MTGREAAGQNREVGQYRPKRRRRLVESCTRATRRVIVPAVIARWMCGAAGTSARGTALRGWARSSDDQSIENVSSGWLALASVAKRAASCS